MKLDWERGHGPVTGPINAAAATLTCSWAGHLLDTPWPVAAAIAGAGLAGTHIAGRRKNMTRHTLVMRAAGWLGAGGWSSWAIANGPWTTWGIGSLTAGAIGLGAAIAGAHAAEAQASTKAAEAEAAATLAKLAGNRQALATEWQQRIARVCGIEGLTVAGIEDWPAGGYSIDAELPAGGATWKEIARRADALAADARLPEGCGVEVSKGAHRGAVVLDVSTENHLIDDVYYPSDYSPLTVNQPVPIGVRRDGTPYGPVNRQASMLIVGQRGSGKSNLMHAMVANQCRMTDSLTWVIDLNGGGLALKWMRAWHAAGRPGRPPIDWVADTPDKALAMAQVLVNVAKARKVGYQDREIAADDDKLPVDHEVPEIRVFNDEGAEIFSTRNRRDETLRQIADYLIQTLEIARAAAVNETTSGLRATQDVLSDPQILKQSTFKAGMKVADDAELNYFFGYNHNASSEDAPYPGCALVRDGDGQVHPVKIYRIKPSQIADIVKATADRHPALDDLSRRVAGEAYERRWEGTDHLFGLAAAPAPATLPSTTSTTPTTTPRRGSGVTANWGTTPAPTGIQDNITAADDAIRRLHDKINETSSRDDDLDAQFQAVVQQGGLAWQAPTTDDSTDTDGEATTDPRYQHIYRIVEGAGPNGIGPAAITDAFTRLHPDETPPNPTVIGRWLKADDRIHQPKFGRYATQPNSAEPEPDSDNLTQQINDLMPQAMELVIAKQCASATFLQRNLRCPWDVANGLLLVLVAAGVIHPEPDAEGGHRVLRQPDGE
ncbi:hypothetical protein [Streptomyces lavendofoliae]|uniref:FtsK gamma domain-containing protein n=1 Tax=Streptomyces lavendofoliae TaxID=67314 RepID=A0A918I398_9ACTN|nr:hypothetical protein [Streptomyces lavendofoliae]GGU62623.1 hypothetical protein GCM10010274_59280 [Streptomyces lavendofoliae]